MPFAPVGNLIDTEVRQRRVKRSASSRVRMTLRGLPEPTDVEVVVEFHSFGTIGASAARDESIGLRIGAADEYARVEVGAPLRAEFLDPSASLDALERCV